MPTPSNIGTRVIIERIQRESTFTRPVSAKKGSEVDTTAAFGKIYVPQTAQTRSPRAILGPGKKEAASRELRE
jgi:hypothetical protein